MKGIKIFYRPIEGSAPLTVSFSSSPKGDATESLNEKGVGFFSNEGTLLGAIFDNVNEKRDHQLLEFKNGISVELKITNKKAKISVHHSNLAIAN